MKTKRQRWFQIRHRSSLDAVRKKLIKYNYSKGNKIGFDLIEFSQRKIKARFIEEKQVSETITLPFGGTQTVTSVKYIIFPFKIIQISPDIALLKLSNPSVSLKSFVNMIGTIYENDFAISKIKFEIASIIEFLSKSEKIDRYTINKLKVGAIPYSETTTASLKLLSTVNAYEEFLKLHNQESYKLEKITINGRISGQLETVTISVTGAISSSGFDSVIQEYVLNKNGVVVK